MSSRDGWRRVKFGDVVRHVKEKVDPESSELERYVAGENMDTDELQITRWGTIGDGYLGPAFHRRFRSGQVLYGSRRTYLRKVALADFDGICANTTFVCETKDPDVLLPELLPFLMQTEAFHAHSIAQSKGSVNPYINWPDLASYEFDLPLLETQRSLVRKLNVCADLRRKRRRLLERCGVAERVVLEEVFNPAWPTVRTDQAGQVQLGLQRHPKYQTGKHSKPYLRVANVGDDELFLDDVLTMDFAGNDFEKYRLQAGDVLLNEGQSIELVGRASLFEGEIQECCFQKTLLRFRPSPEVDPLFALSWFRRAFYRGELSKLARRTSSMAHLTAVRFRAFPFPLPPLSEQKRVAERMRVLRDARLQLRRQLTSDRSTMARIAERLLQAT